MHSCLIFNTTKMYFFVLLKIEIACVRGEGGQRDNTLVNDKFGPFTQLDGS